MKTKMMKTEACPFLFMLSNHYIFDCRMEFRNTEAKGLSGLDFFGKNKSLINNST